METARRISSFIDSSKVSEGYLCKLLTALVDIRKRLTEAQNADGGEKAERKSIGMDTRSHLETKGLAPGARFEIATLRLTVAALHFPTEMRWFAMMLILRASNWRFSARPIATRCDSFRCREGTKWGTSRMRS